MPPRKTAQNAPQAPLVDLGDEDESEVERLSRVWRDGPDRVEPVFTEEQEAARAEGQRLSELRRSR